jgi:TRAP-type transport system small permease protein
MFKTLIDRYCRLLTAFMVGCMAVMVFMVFGNVVLRYGFNSGIAVSEELSRWLFLWLVFLGATIAVHERSHMGTDMLVAALPAPLQKLCFAVGYILMLFTTWLMFSGSLTQARINLDVQAPVTGASMAWVYGAGLVFSVSTGIMLLHDLWRLLTGRLTPSEILSAHLTDESAPPSADATATAHR